MQTAMSPVGAQTRALPPVPATDDSPRRRSVAAGVVSHSTPPPSPPASPASGSGQPRGTETGWQLGGAQNEFEPYRCRLSAMARAGRNCTAGRPAAERASPGIRALPQRFQLYSSRGCSSARSSARIEYNAMTMQTHSETHAHAPHRFVCDAVRRENLL